MLAYIISPLMMEEVEADPKAFLAEHVQFPRIRLRMKSYAVTPPGSVILILVALRSTLTNSFDSNVAINGTGLIVSSIELFSLSRNSLSIRGTLTLPLLAFLTTTMPSLVQVKLVGGSGTDTSQPSVKLMV